MKVLDLFSGIGGFSHGLERAGMTTAAFCEIDPFCRKVLKKHWPNVPVFEDIKTLKGDEIYAKTGLHTVDLVCGGFPCQPFSNAGKRRGAGDDRHLWPEMFRIIKELRPNWVLGENVAGFINMGLDSALSDLETAGYETGTFILPACAVQAPHIRERCFIIAHTNGFPGGAWRPKSTGQQREAGASSGGNDFSNSDSTRQLQSQGYEQKFRRRPSYSDNVPHTHDRRRAVRRNGEFSTVKEFGAIRCDNRRGTQEHEPGQRRQTEPRVCRVDDGLPARLDGNLEWPAENVPRLTEISHNRPSRLKSLGNSVVPQLVEIIGRVIMEVEN